MGRSLLAGTDDYDPDTWILLGRAFDAAWQDIAENIYAAEADDRRTRLALVILELARTGKRGQDQIKNAAVHYMRREDRLGLRSF